MPTFRLSIRLLDAAFHGRGDGGEPEWPPSPLRAFQALVNAAARRWRESQFEDYARPALQWLEGLGSPAVVAPPGRAATRPYRLYVPNNAGDLMVSAWARGDGEASMTGHRTEKEVRPTRFAGPDRRPLASNPDLLPIHFDWQLAPSLYEEGKTYEGTLKAAARSITHLGWGVDQAVGHAELLADAPRADPTAEEWLPSDAADTQLRVPQVGTLDNLCRKHQDFLERLSGNSFRPVPPLTAFRVVGYRRATDPVSPFHWAAYRIMSVSPDDPNPAFATAGKARDVACWVRNAVGRVAAGQGWDDVGRFVHGHDPVNNTRPAKGEGADDRLLFLPLPTIQPPPRSKVESVRRVLVAGPVRCRDRVERVGRLLEGEELKWDEKVKGVLVPLAASDWVLGRYVGKSRAWSTVTPVVWPRHDDRDPRKAARVLRRAFKEAGLPPDVVDAIPDEDLEWRNVGFRPGVDLVVCHYRFGE